MMYFLLWAFFCVAAGMFAEYHRKRNGVGWFFVAFFFSPLVAFVLLVILPVKGPKQPRLRVINPPPAFGGWDAVRNVGKVMALIVLTIGGVAGVVITIGLLGVGPQG